MDYSAQLREVSIFRFVPVEILEEVSHSFVHRVRAKDDIILRQGELVAGLYIILRGRVEVFTKEYNGPLAILAAGSSFGEMSLIEKGEKASAGIRVIEDNTQVLLCGHTVFNKLLTDNIPFSAHFFRGTADKCHRGRH